MAGDYIQWVKGLTQRREVVVMSSVLSMSRREVASSLMEWWEWCDDNGHFDEMPPFHCHAFVTPLSYVDEHIRVTGFAQAMQQVGWLQVETGQDGSSGLLMPNLGRYIGTSAKQRALARERKAKQRLKDGKSVTKLSRAKRDENVTREEKRRDIDSTNVESCSEPPEAGNSEPSVLVFPCVGKGPKEWGLSQAKLSEYQEAFPGVDAIAECRKALQWCRDNTTKRKTAQGMQAFLGRWLAAEQNRSAKSAPPKSTTDGIVYGNPPK